MNLFRILNHLLFGALLSYQILPTCSISKILPEQRVSQNMQTDDDDLPIARKDPTQERDQMLWIVLGEVNKRVSLSNFSRGMDDFIGWLDDVIGRIRQRARSQVRSTVGKSSDPAEMIFEIISESFYKDDLIRVLNDLRLSLMQAKRETLFLPQIAIFQSLSPEAQAAFRAGVRVEDKLDELPRIDKRRLAKIQLNPDHLKILLIQRLTQITGMGRDRASTLADSKRLLTEFKNKIPATMAVRNFIDDFLLGLDRKANEQSAVPIVLARIIEFMPSALQVRSCLESF